MRESRLSGSVEGVRSNPDPYSDSSCEHWFSLPTKLVGLLRFVPTPDNRASTDVRENLEPRNRCLSRPFQVRHGLFKTHSQGVRTVRILILHEFPEAPDLIRQLIEGPVAFLFGNVHIKQKRWRLVHLVLLTILAHHQSSATHALAQGKDFWNME